MKIFVVVGMPAAGKNLARDYATARGIPYYATGDLVRAEVVLRGIEATPDNMASVSTELRGADGMGVTRLALETALHADASIVMLEGMRSWDEIELIRQQATAVIIAFLAPLAMRRKRIIARGRSDDSADAFHERDQRELAYGTAIPIVLADEYILNTGTMEEAIQGLNDILEKYR